MYKLNTGASSNDSSATPSIGHDHRPSKQSSRLLRYQLPPQQRLLELEIRLLESLANSDDAVDELVSLWNQSGGTYYDEYVDSEDDDDTLETIVQPPSGAIILQSSHKTLADMELFISIGDQVRLSGEGTEEEIFQRMNYYWDQAEAGLEKLISIYETSWIEPIFKLATLYTAKYQYYQLSNDDITKSEWSSRRLLSKAILQLYQIVISVKPWHTPALNGIVGICKERNETIQAEYWVQQCIPSLSPTSPTSSYDPIDDDSSISGMFKKSPSASSPPPPSKSRKEWINQMVFAAQQKLDIVAQQAQDERRLEHQKLELDVSDGDEENGGLRINVTAFDRYLKNTTEMARRLLEERHCISTSNASSFYHRNSSYVEGIISSNLGNIPIKDQNDTTTTSDYWQ